MATTPFDPLKAGWRLCGYCQGYAYLHEGPCRSCDGLGIVVTPPEDGIPLSYFFAGKSLIPVHRHKEYTAAFWAEIHKPDPINLTKRDPENAQNGQKTLCNDDSVGQTRR